MTRHDERAHDQLREIDLLPGIAPYATGSVLVSFGYTRVICSVMIEQGVPRWMKEQRVPGGWLTAEYSMLPYSTLRRKRRDVSAGRIDGRSSEIQRLIGRSLRAVVDLRKVGERTVWVDCDVLQADGGTRTASITGACVAVDLAFNHLIAEGVYESSPLREQVAAVSAGVVDGQCLLDLDYVEDKGASVDFNYVLTESLEFVEVQGSGEETTFSEAQMQEMLALSRKGVQELVEKQREAVRAGETGADGSSLQALAAHFGR
jgi:ribonuclease PH